MRSRRAKNNVVLNALLVTIMDVATTTATTNLTDVGETHHARAPLRGDLIARGTTGFLGFLGDALAHAVVMDTQETMVIVNVNLRGSATDVGGRIILAVRLREPGAGAVVEYLGLFFIHSCHVSGLYL